MSRSQVTTMTRIIPLKDVSHVLGLTYYLLSLRTVAADDSQLHGKGQCITFCSYSLRFLPRNDIYCLYSFRIAKKMLRTMPYIRDVPRYDVWHDNKTISIREDTANKTVVAPNHSLPIEMDINVWNPSIVHVNDPLLTVSKNSTTVELTRTLHSCEGCLATKDLGDQF